MKFVCTFGIYSAIIVLLISPILCQDEGEVEAPVEKSCQKWIFDLLSIVFDAVGPCLANSFKIQNLGEVVTRLFCFVKCLLSELALIDEEGALDQVAAAIFFGENFPESLRNEIIPKAEPCFKLAEVFNGKEYYCKSYAAFSQCAGTVVIQAMTPYVIGCFGAPFIAAGLNVAFGFLINQTPSGRSFELPGQRGRLGSSNNRTLQMLTTYKPRFDKRKNLRN
ncbi:uncharacterized protein LOC110843203 [Folsomia candida]|uniref:uncharacterized protein LOC110843203 n=1 Tax=Folsomia candida TaxID=158441 RepID=UPI000B8FEE98|nr:uncharacterized protein LOC110843203 [Folsomia candida]